MQRSLLNRRDRGAAIACVVLVHAAVIVAVLNASGQSGLAPARSVVPLETFDVVEVPPPPPPTQEQVQPEEKERAASPPNLESQASPVVSPKPAMQLPVASPIVASETPRQGSDSTQGAAPMPGPGTGAGGLGTGSGGGGSGAGMGGGGRSGEGTRSSVVESTKLTGRDYPSAVLDVWPRGRRIFVAVRVQLDGRATDCRVDRSSGNPVVDAWTCRLVEQRVRFRPALDEQGRPFVSWYGYVQYPVNF